MNMFLRHCMPVFAAFWLCAGCSPPQRSSQAIKPDPKPADLSKDEVISIARETAEEKGINLQDYEEPKLTLHSEGDKRKIWLLFYERRTAIVGDDFWLSVNDQTRTARFFHRGH